MNEQVQRARALVVCLGLAGCLGPPELETRGGGLTTPDVTHTGVAAVGYVRADGRLGLVCSGALVAPNVVVTAGHCTSDLESRLALGTIAAAMVSFDDQITQSASVVTGTPITHPDLNLAAYNINNDTHDVGVLVLDDPVDGRDVYALPAAGLLAARRLRVGTPLVAVGYGVDPLGGHGASAPDFSYENDRRRERGEIRYRNVSPAYVLSTQLSQQGSDGPCFGDSGGPVFAPIGGGEQLVGLGVVVNSYDCQEVAWSVRLDTASSLSFLSAF